MPATNCQLFQWKPLSLLQAMRASADLSTLHSGEGDFLSKAMKVHHEQAHDYGYGSHHKEGQFLSTFISENKNLVNDPYEDMSGEVVKDRDRANDNSSGTVSSTASSLEQALLTRQVDDSYPVPAHILSPSVSIQCTTQCTRNDISVPPSHI